jgi:hypothetical protein
MAVLNLDFPAPRGEAAQALNELVAARRRLDDRLDEVGEQQRRASEEVVRASEALSELERRGAGGEAISAEQRRKAEAALNKARIEAGEPWGERITGLRAAGRDADAAVARFVGEHLNELLAEIGEDAEAAAADVDRACHRLVEAYGRRMEVDRQITVLAGQVRPVRPGDVRPTRAEEAVAAAAKLLQQGGEQAPTLVTDPREPRHAAPAIPASLEPDPLTMG